MIRNEDHMKCFIRFLCHALKTVDGNRDSAEGIYKALINQEVMEKKRQKINVTDFVMEEIEDKVRH